MVLKQYAPLPVPMSAVQKILPMDSPSADKERGLLDVDLQADEIGFIHWPLIAQVQIIVLMCILV